MGPFVGAYRMLWIRVESRLLAHDGRPSSTPEHEILPACKLSTKDPSLDPREKLVLDGIMHFIDETCTCSSCLHAQTCFRVREQLGMSFLMKMASLEVQ